MSNNGAQPPAAASANPLLQLGRSPTRASDQADRGLPSGTPRSPASPADHNGSHPKGVADLPLTKGRPREQCRRRPPGRNGCEEDDRSSDPRFRSAPTERQASVGCERYLHHRRPLVPHQADQLCRRPVPDHAPPAPDPRPGRRHSAPCTNTALVHSISTDISTETASHSALILQSAAQTSNEAALRAARAAAAAPWVLPSVDTAVLHGAHQLDDNAVSVRDCPLRVPPPPGQRGRMDPSGHRQPSRRLRPRVTRQGCSACGGRAAA